MHTAEIMMIAAARAADQAYTPLFADLYQYIHESLLAEAGIDPDADDFDVMDAIRACSGKLEHAEQFCLETDVDADSLRRQLNDAGAHCDCEIMLNATVYIDEEQELPRRW